MPSMSLAVAVERRPDRGGGRGCPRRPRRPRVPSAVRAGCGTVPTRSCRCGKSRSGPRSARSAPIATAIPVPRVATQRGHHRQGQVAPAIEGVPRLGIRLIEEPEISEPPQAEPEITTGLGAQVVQGPPEQPAATARARRPIRACGNRPPPARCHRDIRPRAARPRGLGSRPEGLPAPAAGRVRPTCGRPCQSPHSSRSCPARMHSRMCS